MDGIKDGSMLVSTSNKQQSQHQQRHLRGRNNNFHHNHRNHVVVATAPSIVHRGGRRKSANQQHHNVRLFGKFNRDVYKAICGRLGDKATHIPIDSVQAIFNDMKLYPSNKEVTEMLQCARQVGKKNGASQYLTFGELCYFVREMQHPRNNKAIKKPGGEKRCSKFEVFLGGSCNPTTWRTETAIPELKKHGITYYNPQVAIWRPELVEKEYDAKRTAALLLFVIDSQTRSVAGMIEVAYLVANGRCVVLVAHPYKKGQCIMEEPLTNNEFGDLVHAQTSLLTLVKTQGVNVHHNLTSAIQCTANILRKNSISADEQVSQKLRRLKEVFDSFDVKRTAEISLMDVLAAYERLTRKTIAMRSLCAYLRVSVDDAHHMRITFGEFCALVAEYGGCDGCEMDDGWIHQSSNNNTITTEGNVLIEGSGNVEPMIESTSTTTSTITTNSPREYYDMYLGGSCNTSHQWRDTLIAHLTENNLTHFNPAATIGGVGGSASSSSSSSVEDGDDGGEINESRILQWHRTIDRCRTLFFYITNDTRSLTTMILAAHYIGLRRNVILCVEQLPHEEFTIGTETLSKQAIKDYNRGRVYLHDLAKRKQIPVFENVGEAMVAAVERAKQPPQR